MRQKVLKAPEPSVAAASSCSVPTSRSTGTTSRTTNGRQMKIVARTMPGIAKMTCMPRSSAAGPNQPSLTPHQDQREADHHRARARAAGRSAR